MATTLESIQGSAKQATNALNSYSTAGGLLRGAGNTGGGGVAESGNPYELMYRDNAGYIFGKPMAFIPRTDPAQRVFQKTMLRNNTIINIIPGMPFQDEKMLSTAKKIIEDAYKEIAEARANSPEADQALYTKLNDISTKAQQKLVAAGCDLRFASFKQDVAGFMEAFQMILSRTANSVFGMSGAFSTDYAAISGVVEDSSLRGFKVWVEKGTSVSESIDNSFTRSVLEDTTKNISGIVKQAKFIGQGAGIANMEKTSTDVISESNKQIEAVGQINNLASRTLSGANFEFPQVFDESKFNRSYNISFRFESPRGDDRSIMYHVLMPFLFLLTCSASRQEGPTGHVSPFVLQVDAPGYFSCPMGVITNMSFRKGGDEVLFNDRGLPLVIEGSLSIMDLYSNLSIPLTNSQFATNFGMASFLGTLGGLSLYAALDPSIKQTLANYASSGIVKVLNPLNVVNEETLKIKRFFGVSN